MSGALGEVGGDDPLADRSDVPDSGSVHPNSCIIGVKNRETSETLLVTITSAPASNAPMIGSTPMYAFAEMPVSVYVSTGSPANVVSSNESNSSSTSDPDTLAITRGAHARVRRDVGNDLGRRLRIRRAHVRYDGDVILDAVL